MRLATLVPYSVQFRMASRASESKKQKNHGSLFPGSFLPRIKLKAGLLLLRRTRGRNESGGQDLGKPPELQAKCHGRSEVLGAEQVRCGCSRLRDCECHVDVQIPCKKWNKKISIISVLIMG